MSSSEETDSLRLLSDSVDDFVKRSSDLKRVRQLRGSVPGFSEAVWKGMAEQGWLGVLVPESLGGQGLGFAEARVIAAGTGGALFPEPFTACAVLATRQLLLGTNDAIKRELLPAMTSGALLMASAWQEDYDGTDAHVAATLQAAGDGFALTGRKRFMAPLYGVQGYIATAMHGSELVLCHVAAHSAGVRIDAGERADGTFMGSVEFRGTPVPAGQIIARGHAAQAALARSLDEAAILAGAELCGVMSNALSLTLDYLKTRVQFGKPIGSFQALQHRAVDLWIQKALSLATVDRAVRMLDEHAGADVGRLASRVKSRCADAALEITRECIRLHGAIGYTDDYDAGLYFKRAVVLSAWLGNGAEHRRRFDATREDNTSLDAATPARRAETRYADLPGAPGERARDTDWNTLTDEQFRLEATAFYEKHYPQEQRFMQRRPHKKDVLDYMRTCSKYGWLAPAWPRKWGGMGLSPSKQVVLFEERERIGVTRILEHGINLLGPALMKFGTEEQKQKYLPKIMSCEHFWCQGYSEPNAGSDLAALQTEAVADGDHYVVNGTKIWLSLADDANHMFFLARTDKQAKRQAGITFFVTTLDTPGITVRPITNLTGQADFCQVFLENVRVPKDNIVGGLNNGWTVAKGLLGFERLNSGSPRRPLYPMLKTRELAKARGLWDNPDFRARYTRLELDIGDHALLYQQFADVISSGGVPGPDMSMLKIWSSETTMRMNMLMIEAGGSAAPIRGDIDFGGVKVDIMGSMYIVFPATISAGSNDIQRNILAKRALGLP